MTKQEICLLQRHALRLLVDAYEQGEESHSINWEDIDLAYGAALVALEAKEDE